MAQTIGDLVFDVLPRLSAAPRGISIYQAANSVLSIVYKKLLERDSDLLVSGKLNLIIPAGERYADLPEDFVSLAEDTEIAQTDLDINLDGGIPSGTPAPEQQGFGVDGGNTSDVIPTVYQKRSMQPRYLREDRCDDLHWWSNYGFYGENGEHAYNNPPTYKIIGNQLYVRPAPDTNVLITGKYHQKPIDFSGPKDLIPWGFFNEVFREGVVMVIMKGLAMPDADPTFFGFIKREVDTVVNARTRNLPQRRTDRRSFL